jgi:RNA polymerase sigma factor (sigma-70 family)
MTDSSHADNELKTIRLAMQGDHGAFGRLVRQYQNIAVAYAASLLGDYAQAEDAAQDAFVEAYRSLSALHRPEAFRAWFKRVIFKQCDRITRMRRSVTVQLEHAEHLASSDVGPAEQAQLAHRHELVHAAIALLSEAERSVTLLFYMGSHSHDEVAEFLQIAPNTVKSRLHSARIHLRERLATVMEIDPIQETLTADRPSNTPDFAERVITLIAAIDAGKTDEVKRLVAGDPSLADAKTPRKWWSGDIRALHVAVDDNNLEIVESLLQAGADPNAMSDRLAWRPLHLALGKPDISAMLIRCGAEVDIFAACGLGDEARVRELIAAEPSSVYTAGPDGATPLHFACTPAIAAMLLEAGADIDAPDSFHEGSPLIWSIRNRSGVARYLIDRGATIDLWSACALGLTEQLRAMLEADPTLVSKPTTDRNLLRAGFVAYPLHIAARYGSVAGVTVLLDHGADPLARSSDGSLAIHDAAFMGHTDVLRLLIERGSPKDDIETTYNCTPLALARYAKHPETTAWLERIGAQ